MAGDASHPGLELIRRRATADRFDEMRGLSDLEIRALVADAVHAPSSFNIQHWRFLAVREPAAKARLTAAAFGQSQVASAPVTFVILGDVQGVEKLSEILEVAVARGALAEGRAVAWTRLARQIYTDPQLARDEAIRSASLAAMNLMLAAEARGLASAALAGFDAPEVGRAFGIGERYLPVMLLAVGYPLRDAAETPLPRMPRLDVDEVLFFDSWPAEP